MVYQRLVRIILLWCAVICLWGSEETVAFNDTREDASASFSTKNIQSSGQAALTSQEPTTCEYAMAALDDSVITTREVKDTYLIIIARLGAGERINDLNKTRLGLIQTSYLKRYPDIKYVLAEGSRAKGLGTIELYVGGKLLYTLFFEKNEKSFCPYRNKDDVAWHPGNSASLASK